MTYPHPQPTQVLGPKEEILLDALVENPAVLMQVCPQSWWVCSGLGMVREWLGYVYGYGIYGCCTIVHNHTLTIPYPITIPYQ